MSAPQADEAIEMKDRSISRMGGDHGSVGPQILAMSLVPLEGPVSAWEPKLIHNCNESYHLIHVVPVYYIFMNRKVMGFPFYISTFSP